MTALVECVANFSEGRRPASVRQIVAAIRDVPGVIVLGAESDADHNRSVVTFVGAPDAATEGAFAGVRQAVELIDMERHRGQHPRVGAADVVPFIPLRGASMADCVEQARRLGARVGRELGLPVFLYEKAALQRTSANLADIRRGGYERLKQSIVMGEAPQPDFGPRQLGSAGACIIGARGPLIAFNVYLTTADVAVARRIARAIRASSGGLPHVMALGVRVKGAAQVSMNLTNYKVTSIQLAVAAIRREAKRWDVDIASSEIVGLIPRDALSESEAVAFKVGNYSLERVLEYRLRQLL